MHRNKLTHSEIQKINQSWDLDDICICKSIVEVSTTSKPKNDDFKFLLRGAACLLQNFPLKYLSIKVFCFDKNKFVLDEKISPGFHFEFDDQYFIQFEGINCIIGLKFSDHEEASLFAEKLTNAINTGPINFSDKKKCSSLQSIFTKKSNSKKKDIETNIFSLGKETIGNPINFRSGSCEDAERPTDLISDAGLDIDTCDMRMKVVLEYLNLPKDALSDPKLSSKVIALIRSSGGVDTIYKSIEKQNPIKKSNSAKENRKKYQHMADNDSDTASISSLRILTKPPPVSSLGSKTSKKSKDKTNDQNTPDETNFLQSMFSNEKILHVENTTLVKEPPIEVKSANVSPIKTKVRYGVKDENVVIKEKSLINEIDNKPSLMNQLTQKINRINIVTDEGKEIK